MNTQLTSNFKHFADRLSAVPLAAMCAALLLTACSSASPAPQPPGPAPALQPQVGSHPPVILRVEDRQEVIDGFLWIYQDVYFTDPNGDAAAMTYQQVASSFPYPLNFADDPIEASPAEQEGEALFTVAGKCSLKMELAFESRIRDEAGNLSEPVLFTMSCTTPPAVDKRSYLVSGLSTALPIALLLGLGLWLPLRKRPGERLPLIRVTLLMLCLLMLFRFTGLVLHEGGHCLYPVSRGVPFTLYVHPFLLPGYCRPAPDNIWKDILGSMTSLPLAALISLPFWKRRSFALLPVVMLFPYVAVFQDGINISGFTGGDFRNLVLTNGLSPIPFSVLGVLIFLAGTVLLFSLFPLLGLDPKDNKVLFVLPAAMFLLSLLSFLVAVLFVPGSPIDREYFLAREIMAETKLMILHVGFGLLLAVLYITLFRKIHPRLPAWLRTDTVALTWKDLRLPAILAAVSVILGLIIVL